jgi:hypothetical protein
MRPTIYPKHMTAREREALDLAATAIRQDWICTRDGERGRARKAHHDAQDAARGITPINVFPEQPKPTAAEAYIANVKLTRPLGHEDVAHIAALTVETWGPNYLTKTRTQRKRLRELKRQMRFPDPTGLMFSGPSEEDLKEFPELRQVKPVIIGQK